MQSYVRSPTFPISVPDFITTLKELDIEIICFKLRQQVLPIVEPQVQLKIFNSNSWRSQLLAAYDPTSQKKNIQRFQEAKTKFLLQQ